MEMEDEVMTDIVAPSWEHPHFDSYRTNIDDLRVVFACEEFGEMLGICDETCEAVKKQILEDEQEISLPALKLLIGFSDCDLTYSLVTKIRGLKFLSLVCALTTAFTPQECAQMLAKLMKCHLKRVEERYPTTEDLLPLISSINARCQLSGFSEHVANYEIQIIHCLRDRRHDAASTRRLERTPDVDAVIKIVTLMKNLQDNTPGPGLTLKAFSIQAGLCAPWIAAFLHWWYNKESMIYLEDDSPKQCQKLVHGFTKVGLKLIFPIDEYSPQYIRIRELYSASVWKNWYFGLGKAKQYTSFVSIPTFFRLTLCVFRLDRGQPRRAAVEALPFALSEAWKGLTMCSGPCVARDRWGAPCIHEGQQARLRKQQIPESSRVAEASHAIYTTNFDPFPSRQDINRVLQLVPGCEGQHMQDLRSKEMGTPIHFHGAVAAFLELRVFEAERLEWANALFKSQFTPLLEPGVTTLFKEQIAHLVALVLALALFEGVEGLRVRPDPMVWRRKGVRPSTVISAIFRVFRKKKGCCDVEEWHRVCRILAGELRADVDDGEIWQEKGEETPEKCSGRDNTIISCDGGQVVWPAVLFQDEFPQDGESYLKLCWRRGNLYDQDNLRRYDRVVGSDSRTVPHNIPRKVFEIPSRLTKDNMLASGNHITLEREEGSQGILKCALIWSLDSGGGTGSGIHVDPSGIIKNLASAERIEACIHSHDAPMNNPIHMNIYTTDHGPIISTSGNSTSSLADVYLCAPDDALPWYWDWASRINQMDHQKDDQGVEQKRLNALLEHVRSGTGSKPGAVAAIRSEGDEKIQIFALTKPVGAHVVVRKRACVECCVKYCMDNGFDILVL
ncbi:uncharacterized protein GGS22DRAFT_190392 [Annulohypoxylon maeteangense]|uniref:uncharacterized protein n=1 Tax=Annulohypoxylon maeteangense TaxID=1927788 RepID=UPI002008339F|nr:uncharacterized protein GGS22DRAFT_190392 [Annulohypoxylon maeteangense]KAI0883085.1 hypothetical protein GGS22DRAFT_190392 [Annulohypoxylon maeteangense]